MPKETYYGSLAAYITYKGKLVRSIDYNIETAVADGLGPDLIKPGVIDPH